MSCCRFGRHPVQGVSQDGGCGWDYRQFSREFELETIWLAKGRGVSVAQASRNLDIGENVLRRWIKEAGADPGQAFPGQGRLKPEQLEIDRLRREVAKLKTKHDILKKLRLTSRGSRY